MWLWNVKKELNYSRVSYRRQNDNANGTSSGSSYTINNDDDNNDDDDAANDIYLNGN